MKIAIVGAGVVGVTTAFELALDGHAVTVFEQRSATAEEASFATGGLLAPGVLDPWSAPGAASPPSVLGRHAAMRVGRSISLAELSWLRRWRRAAYASAHSGTPLPSLVALERLARYSHARLQHLAESLDLAFEHSPGTLLLLRTPRDAEALAPALKALRDAVTAALQFQRAARCGHGRPRTRYRDGSRHRTRPLALAHPGWRPARAERTGRQLSTVCVAAAPGRAATRRAV